MASAPYCLNTAWMLGCAREALAFRQASGDVQRTQERLLLRILRENQDTWYGRQHAFAGIRSPREFQQRVPVVGYEQLRRAIDRIAAGETGVLTEDRVTLLEQTGGSSQAEKLIPYNATLRRDFQRAIAVWVFDVLRGLPKVRKGKAYWSISPWAQLPRASAGGIPIGFNDDREYLSNWQQWAVSRLMVIPAVVRQLRSVDNARYVTALYLLTSGNLSLISVWSPTFLTALISGMPAWIDPICEDLESGRIRLPHPQLEQNSLELTIRRDARRAGQLRAAFTGTSSMADALSQCWPQLAMISCWGDASSSIYLPALRAHFPHVYIQPKGLLATEGVVSVPLLSTAGSVLAVRSHFLEFREIPDRGDPGNSIRLADELEAGRQYRVILTTGGGLYRYDLGDEIEVIDYHNRCPCIRFLGRGDYVSDLVGEKLHEHFVRAAVTEVISQLGLKVCFALVSPLASSPPRYQLFLQTERNLERESVSQMEDSLEVLLKKNPHYRIAVEARQLQPVSVKLLRSSGWRVYEDTWVRRGRRLGDIKPLALDNWDGWDRVFTHAIQTSQ